jgi:hypothetical protein
MARRFRYYELGRMWMWVVGVILLQVLGKPQKTVVRIANV